MCIFMLHSIHHWMYTSSAGFCAHPKLINTEIWNFLHYISELTVNSFWRLPCKFKKCQTSECYCISHFK